jgi:hypothetical protein
MTALKAAEPQSQDAQASTLPLLVAWVPDLSSDDGCIASGALAVFIGRMLSARGEHRVDELPDTRQSPRQGRPGRQNCRWCLDKLRGLNLTNDRLLLLLTIESLTLRRYQ